MKNLINKISILGEENIKKLKLIAFLNFSTFIIEFISLGSLPIFIASLINKEETYSKLEFVLGSNFMALFNIQNLSMILGIFVVLIFIFKNCIFILLIYIQGKFFKKIKQEFSNKFFDFYSKSNYLILYKKNPSIIVRNITNEIQNLLPYLTHLFNLIKEISAVIVIFLLLVYFEPYSTLIISFLFFVISVLYIYFLKPIINKKSKQNQSLRNDFINIVYETFGGIKDIKVTNREAEISNHFQKKLNIYEDNLFSFFFLERLPRFILEILAIFVISILSFFYLGNSDENISNIPSLSLFIIGAIRFLPAFSGITLSRYYLKLFNPSLSVLKNELDMVKNFQNLNDNISEKKNNLNFKDQLNLELKDIDFKYPEENYYLFKKLNLKINDKDKIGISGPSGCGKSTLFDILLGLIKPIKGQVLINNHDLSKNLNFWRSKIGYVSQNLFIQDSTFRENIAFNYDNKKIDDKKIDQAIEISGLINLIKNSTKGLETPVGTNGLKLSGGERQRLALARAIYRDPEVFFLDEFTSALDSETEEEIFKKIFQFYGNKTFIIIAHRESVLQNCTKRYFLDDGQLKEKL